MRAIIRSIALLAIVACETKTDNRRTEDTVPLVGLYATSVNLPQAAYGPANLFDGSPVPWATMPGTDRMEGVMLYFASDPGLDAMEFTPSMDRSMTAPSRLKVFTDGVEAGAAVPGMRFPLDVPGFSSLYLKIEELTPTVEQAARAPAAVQELRFYRDGREVRIVPMDERIGNVTASSTLAPTEAYSPLVLFDSRRDFGWAEGARGDGNGESLVFEFANGVTIAGLRIWNGYQRSDVHFTANARVKSFTFGADAASARRYSSSDAPGMQEVRLASPLTGQRFTMRIDEVFRGTAYRDLVISELQFFDGHRWFTMDIGREVDDRKRALITRVRGTALETVLDRTITGRDGTSMTLRSNGSFVVWIMDSSGEVAEMVADGNWRVLSADASTARVSIFGRVRALRETFEVYRRGGSAEMVRVFEDELTVQPARVRARKLFADIEYD
jgi:hypothetical protein